MSCVNTTNSLKIIIFAVLMLACFHTLTAQNATAAVKGGMHDMSTPAGPSSALAGGWTQEVCVFCHTPHASNTRQSYTTNPKTQGIAGTLVGAYLWNRPMPVSTFDVYSSPTFSQNPNNATTPQPGTESLLCLSCHDGVGGMNVMLNYPNDWIPDNATAVQFGDFPSDPVIGMANIGNADTGGGDTGTGTDLRNDHPIGFNYATAQGDPSNTGGLKVNPDPPIDGRLTLTGGRVECNTCHDPHKTNPSVAHNMFLVITTGSDLCLGCHIK